MAQIGTITTKPRLEQLTIRVRIHPMLKVRMAIGAFFVRCAAWALGGQCEVEIMDKRDA